MNATMVKVQNLLPGTLVVEPVLLQDREGRFVTEDRMRRVKEVSIAAFATDVTFEDGNTTPFRNDFEIEVI